MRFPYGYHGRLRAFPGIPGNPTDTVPDAFSFTDRTDVALSAVTSSNTITPTGFTSTTTISITGSGAEYRIDGGSYTSSSGSFSPGSTLQLRMTSSAATTDTTIATPNLGGVTDTWSVTTGDGTQAVLVPEDFTFVGNLRITQQLGPGGTGTLSDTGPAGTFWKNVDGTIDFFMMGHNYEGYATRYPLVQFRYDPATQTPNPSMSSAPQMPFIRDWGEFRDGHIISAAGNQTNYINGALLMEAYPGDSTKRLLWWTYGDGYVPTVDYPTLSCSVLNMTSHTVEAIYGPWRGDVAGRRFLTGQIIKLPEDFVSDNCPGYSKAIIGVMGSGLTNSPFGPSLIAIEDFNPTTLAPSTGTGQAANFACKYLIHHDLTHRKSRATDFKVCRWDGGNGTTQKYACQYGATEVDAVPLWGGVDMSGDLSGAGETDSQQAVVWINTPDKRGVLFFCKMNGRPPGGSVDPHMGYAKSLHVSDTQGGTVETSTPGTYHDKACCHNFYDPEWGSTGPFSTSRRPKVLIYDGEDFADAVDVGGSTDPWDHVPTTEAFDLYDINSTVPTHLATDASDYASIFGFSGSAWFDEDELVLYVVGGYDFVTDGSGARLPHLMLYVVGA